ATLGDDWYGYGGVGPYRRSHGNTPEVVSVAHRLRDGAFPTRFDQLASVEEYDLVIVGAGMAGLGAALAFSNARTPGQHCLILDNHPMIGGEAKENEFDVLGERLIGPQGANGFFVPPAVTDSTTAAGDPRYYAELGIPREFAYRTWPREEQALRFCRDNYGYLVAGLQHNTSVGHFFAEGTSGSWAVDMFQRRLANTPLRESSRSRLLKWFDSGALRQFDSPDQARRVLDTMSYEDFLRNELGIGEAGARHADLFLASACGLGSDAVSAFAASQLPMPGLYGPAPEGLKRESFPGGNSGFVRHFLKRLIPDAIEGGRNFEDIVAKPIRVSALDRPAQPVRMRTSATVLHVEHDGDPGTADTVSVIYTRNGEYHGIKAKAVVMATGSWMTPYVVRDLPDAHREACAAFIHAPFLVANIALTNWRFLHKLGISAAIWDRQEDGFGFTCNIRNPMQVGDYQPPLDPDKPIVLSFYTPFHSPGLEPTTQVALGRAELLGTSYAAYERRITSQMLRLFGSAGFEPTKDVAGLILNRWGHAYSVPYPGFYGGANGTAPRDTLRGSHGRVAFAHSELDGLQHWGPAADEGRRAFSQLSNAI
ncbi:MAG: NAD(P)-binding protein, partial [Gemmatimonadota bacterium]|nr:NAD(P)-binding protein [Gemmatimonadota bacterium]